VNCGPGKDEALVQENDDVSRCQDVTKNPKEFY
jgi:hypothetical protein